jgi:hypothetical protein
MSHRPALMFAFAVAFALADRGIAQQKAEDKSQAGAATQQPAASERRSLDKASPILMLTGKVTQVDPAARTFTVAAKGKLVTFRGGNLKSLPKPGDVVDIRYADTPGGPAEAINLNSSKSNAY